MKGVGEGVLGKTVADTNFVAGKLRMCLSSYRVSDIRVATKPVRTAYTAL
jgi:hypothetical protein